jgi:GT2 family glycosyltransferase
MEFSVCIPTLNRYDLLDKCIDSLLVAGVSEERIFIINNGIYPYGKGQCFNPGYNLGLAKSWNTFITHINGPWLISNDDIIFSKQAIDRFSETDIPGIYAPDSIAGMNFFSCFLLFKEVIDRVGLFDEKISPGYAYFEDNDYKRRLDLVNIGLSNISNCPVEHLRSSTIQNFSDKEMQAHHMKFRRAENNYIKKWGGLPNHEVFVDPHTI